MAKELSQEEIKEMIILARFKNGAFKAGVAKTPFDAFADEWELFNTEFSAGHYMEIVMAWMLGYYRTIVGIYLRVKMSFDLDIKGCDFRIMKDRRDFFGVDVDMKFDKSPKDDNADLIKSHVVARTYPIEVGHASNGKTMFGVQALTSVLLAVFTADELRKQISGRKLFIKRVNAVWAEHSKGW